MGVILTIVGDMGIYTLVDGLRKPVTNTPIVMTCACGDQRQITIGAVYRQNRRGHPKYRCPACAGTEGWDVKAKTKASQRSKMHWEDPEYAGVITGKAMAKSIQESVKLESLLIDDELDPSEGLSS